MKKVTILLIGLFLYQDLYSNFVSQLSLISVLLISCVVGKRENRKSPWLPETDITREQAARILVKINEFLEKPIN